MSRSTSSISPYLFRHPSLVPPPRIPFVSSLSRPALPPSLSLSLSLSLFVTLPSFLSSLVTLLFRSPLALLHPPLASHPPHFPLVDVSARRLATRITYITPYPVRRRSRTRVHTHHSRTHSARRTPHRGTGCGIVRTSAPGHCEGIRRHGSARAAASACIRARDVKTRRK